MRDHFQGRPVGVALALAAALAGCGSHHSSGGTPATAGRSSLPAPTSRAAVSASAGPKDAALAAYRGMWAAYVAAARSSDASDPGLARYASAGALRLLRKGLRQDRDQGVVTRGRLVLNPQVTRVKPHDHPKRVWVRDCADASHWLTYKRTSGRRTGGKAGRHHAEAVVEQSDGQWQVIAFFVEKAGTC